MLLLAVLTASLLGLVTASASVKDPVIYEGALAERLPELSHSASYGFGSRRPTGSASLLGDLNPCPEGEFLDLADDVCRPLAKNFGFDPVEFASNFSGEEFTLGSCTQSALLELLFRAKPTGGTIFLPACTIPLTQSITIPGNTIFQGAGRDQTIFQAQPALSGNVLRSDHDENMVVRDLTIDGGGNGRIGILTWYARNVLIERVRVQHNQGSGITFRYAQKVTIRYNESHDHVEFHGISSKDCSPVDDELPDFLECQAQAGDLSPGTLWSRDYAVYSNRLYNNGDYGINIHASMGEVAGNLSENNAYGSKFPDASHVWIHHNQMVGNGSWGLYMYNTLDTSARIAGRSVIYENRFATNGDYPVRIHDPAHSVILIDNRYDDNMLNRLRILGEPTYICPGTTEVDMVVDGLPLQTALLEECDLGQVSNLFPLSTVFLPLAIYE